jgi:ankyrin repeat protein
MVRAIAAGILLAGSCLAAPDLRLIEAVKRRDVKAVDTLLTQHADVNAALPDGATALAWAAFLDLREVAEKLIAAGANVNSGGEYGETPLTLALGNGDAVLADKLLQAGADAKTARWNGETTLMIAARAGSVEAVNLVLDHGADVDAAERERGQNALMWAAAEGHSEVVEHLIQRGADVNAPSKSGFTPLVFAAVKNDGRSVANLLKAGANPNYALPNGMSVLHVSVLDNSSAAVAALLDGGANPNVADRGANTPLHVAAQNGALEIVEELLSKGADPNARTQKTRSRAAASTPPFFRGPGGEQTPLLLAARANHEDVMRALIAAGADPKLKAEDGGTLLMAAAGSGHVGVAKYAYQFDKDVNAVDDAGLTAMHFTVSGTGGLATQTQLCDLVQFLADIGVPLDQQDARGRTPIQVGDGIPLDKPIQLMADIIISRGGTPRHFPKEYVKPGAAR